MFRVASFALACAGTAAAEDEVDPPGVTSLPSSKPAPIVRREPERQQVRLGSYVGLAGQWETALTTRLQSPSVGVRGGLTWSERWEAGLRVDVAQEVRVGSEPQQVGWNPEYKRWATVARDRVAFELGKLWLVGPLEMGVRVDLGFSMNQPDYHAAGSGRLSTVIRYRTPWFAPFAEAGAVVEPYREGVVPAPVYARLAVGFDLVSPGLD